MKQIRRKYRQTRNKFKAELYAAMTDNHALAILAIETYTAWKHQRHIMQMWALLGRGHKEAYQDYCQKLKGRYLSGRIGIWRSFHFAGYPNLHAYNMTIPERIAMGDAVSVAYRVLHQREKE